MLPVFLPVAPTSGASAARAATPPIAGSPVAGHLAGVGNTAACGLLPAPTDTDRGAPPYDLPALETWERGAPANEERGLAAARIRAVLQDVDCELDLGDLRLTELPALPRQVGVLRIAWNRLTSLPALPPRLRELHCSHNHGLQGIPSVPDSLRLLRCGETAVSELPTLPDGLETLWVSDCPLREMPALPAALERLHMSRVSMRALPTLPDGLQVLHAVGCGIENAPERWPSRLRVLVIRDNRLTSVPELPWTVQARDLEGNPWTEPVPQAARPLADAVAAWYPPDAVETGELAAWGTIAQEDGARAFSDFLARLETSTWHDSATFVEQMRAWLDRLACPGNDTLRRNTFAISLDASETCHDRALYALYGMRMLALQADVEAGLFDGRPAELVELGKGFQAFEVLTRLAQDIVDARVARADAASGRKEEIEVYLALVQHFADRLPPLVLDAPMRFRATADLTQAEMTMAGQSVAQLAAAFAAFACNWEPLAKAMQRWNPTRYKEAETLLRDKVDNGDFEPYQRAHGFIGTAAFEALRHDVFLPLVRDYLGAHGLDASWLDIAEVTRL